MQPVVCARDPEWSDRRHIFIKFEFNDNSSEGHEIFLQHSTKIFKKNSREVKTVELNQSDILSIAT